MYLLRKAYNNLEECVGAFMVGLMIICLILQVGVRMLFGTALAWTEELSRFCFIWAVYVGASLAAKRSAHVRIEAQFLLAPPKVRLFFRMLADAVWISFNLFVAWVGYGVVQGSFQFPEISPVLAWNKVWIEMIIPVAFIMMSWRTVEFYVKHLRNGTLYSLVGIKEGK